LIFRFADEITEDWGNGRTSSEYHSHQNAVIRNYLKIIDG
jgi:hypothetical protein